MNLFHIATILVLIVSHVISRSLQRNGTNYVTMCFGSPLGVFTSKEHCEDPRAPKPGFFWFFILWYPVWSPEIFSSLIRIVQPVNQTVVSPATRCQNAFGSVVSCTG